MAPNLRTGVYTPLLLTYGDTQLYLNVNAQGCALYAENNPIPLYQVQEPILLAQGIATDQHTVHLVVLNKTGELCYTLVSRTGNPNTTVLAKLDVRSTKYRRLILLPIGSTVHIFYAYNQQAIPGLWRIEHRFWDGKSWRSVHLGEVFHPREPLYHVALDNQNNIHLLTMTSQSRNSLVFFNRFNGTFHIWGTPTEVLNVPGETIDMTAIMTTDHIHHLFWITKTINNQYELRWAQRPQANELTSTWHQAPAPLRTFSGSWKGFGVMEMNGTLWLLASATDTSLLLYDGKGWKPVTSQPTGQPTLQWIRKTDRSFHSTNWLADVRETRAPLFYEQLGIRIVPAATGDPMLQNVMAQQAMAPAPVPIFEPPPSTDYIPKAKISMNSTSILETRNKTYTPGITPPPSVPGPDLQPPIKQFPSTADDPLQPEPMTSLSQERVRQLANQQEQQNTAEPEIYDQPFQTQLQTVEQSQQDSELTSVPPDPNPKHPSMEITAGEPVKPENTVIPGEEYFRQFEQTIRRLEQENHEVKQTVQTLIATYEKHQETIQSQAAEKLLESEKFRSLRDMITKLEEENQNFNLAIEKILAKFADYQISLEKLENQYQGSEQEKLDPIHQTLSRLEKENLNLTNALDGMLFKLREYAISLEELEQENKSLEKDMLNPLKATVARLEEANQNFTETLASLLTRFDENQSTLQRLEKSEQPCIFSKDITALRDAISKLDEQNRSFATALEAIVERLNAKNTAIEQRLEEQNRFLELKDERLGHLQERIEKLEQNNHALAQALEKTLVKVDQVATSLQTLEESLAHWQQQRELITEEKGFWNRWFK